jgi:hypothetical protein
MFAPPCQLCGASMGDLYLHVAWHVDRGEELTEEGVSRMRERADEIKAQHLADARRAKIGTVAGTQQQTRRSEP